VTGLSFAFIAPVLGALIAQLLRGEITVGNLDSLSKFLFALPVFYYLLRGEVNPLRHFEWIVPLSVYLTALFVWKYPNLEWGADRVTTYFVDPLSFSSLTLILGIISLCLIDLHADDGLLVKCVKFGAFLLGVYLSFLSVSRSGWLAIPFALAFWLRVRKNIPLWLVSVLVFCIVSAILFFFPLVTQKLLRAMEEIRSYSWHGVNHDTSVEMRFTFFRIAWELFKLKPFAGWGDMGFVEALNLPQITVFSTEFTRFFAVDHGFHNEFFTEMVRSGIFGIIPILAVFSIPFGLFIRALCHHDKLIKGYGLLATNYYLVVIVTSISTEVFNIKFVSAFHAMMLAVLSSAIIRLLSSKPSKHYES
jgi:O-antigen ligase